MMFPQLGIESLKIRHGALQKLLTSVDGICISVKENVATGRTVNTVNNTQGRKKNAESSETTLETVRNFGSLVVP